MNLRGRITRSGMILGTIVSMMLTVSVVSAAVGTSDIPIDLPIEDSTSYSEDDVLPPICTVIELEATQESTFTQEVATIIYNEMVPQYSSNPHITLEESHDMANQILYCMDIHGMNVDEDLVYVLSLFYLESKFDPLAENPYSSASGLGQILGMHAWKFPDCEGCRSWYNCDEWMDIEQNVYVAFGIMAYQEYSHCSPENRWRNIYRYNYNTGPGTGGLIVNHSHRFVPLVQEILNE